MAKLYTELPREARKTIFRPEIESVPVDIFNTIDFSNCVSADSGSLQVNIRRFRSDCTRIGFDAPGQMAVRLFNRPRLPRQNLGLPFAPLPFFLDPQLEPLKTHAIPR